MFHASLHIIVCSTRNRISRRMRRLREPRYLVGAIVAAAYLLFNIVGRARARRAGELPEFLLSLQAVLPPLAGVGLLLAAALAWLLPSSGATIEFSDAEVQFLFPAPVSGRGLLIHRLMRSQLGLLFAAVVPVFFFGFASGPFSERMLRWLAVWIVFATARVYFTGVSLTRRRPAAQGSVARLVAWAPWVVVFAAVAVVGASFARGFSSAPIAGVDEALVRIRQTVEGGGTAFVLWPFTALAGPLFARSSTQFATALAGALVVSGVTLTWVLWNDEPLQEMTTRLNPHRPVRVMGPASAPRARQIGWSLALSGRSETMFLWKNSLQTLRRTNLGTVVQYGTPPVLIGVAFAGMRMSETQAQGLAGAFFTFALVAAGFAVLFGPQIMVGDLRTDLRHLELLKTWPVKPAEVVRGEILWPGIVVTSCAWFALLCASLCSAAAWPDWSLRWRLSLAVAAMLLAPAIVFAQYTVHNAAAILFPAWVPLADQRPRGLDAMGQRMILLAGVVLTLAVAITPGVIAGGLVWFIVSLWISDVGAVAGAAMCLTIVAAELFVVTEALGRAYEAIDPTQVERAE